MKYKLAFDNLPDKQALKECLEQNIDNIEVNDGWGIGNSVIVSNGRVLGSRVSLKQTKNGSEIRVFSEFSKQHYTIFCVLIPILYLYFALMMFSAKQKQFNQRILDLITDCFDQNGQSKVNYQPNISANRTQNNASGDNVSSNFQTKSGNNNMSKKIAIAIGAIAIMPMWYSLYNWMIFLFNEEGMSIVEELQYFGALAWIDLSMPFLGLITLILAMINTRMFAAKILWLVLGVLNSVFVLMLLKNPDYGVTPTIPIMIIFAFFVAAFFAHKQDSNNLNFDKGSSMPDKDNSSTSQIGAVANAPVVVAAMASLIFLGLVLLVFNQIDYKLIRYFDRIPGAFFIIFGAAVLGIISVIQVKVKKQLGFAGKIWLLNGLLGAIFVFIAIYERMLGLVPLFAATTASILFLIAGFMPKKKEIAANEEVCADKISVTQNQPTQVKRYNVVNETVAQNKGFELDNNTENNLNGVLAVKLDDEEFSFNPGQVVSIGCSDECDIFIPDPVLDDLQGEFVFEDKEWVYYDKSSNTEVKYEDGAGNHQAVNDPALPKRKQGWLTIDASASIMFSDSKVTLMV